MYRAEDVRNIVDTDQMIQFLTGCSYGVGGNFTCFAADKEDLKTFRYSLEFLTQATNRFIPAIPVMFKAFLMERPHSHSWIVRYNDITDRLNN
jgi:hypothetical protein